MNEIFPIDSEHTGRISTIHRSGAMSFGARRGSTRTHDGIDIGASEGTPIVSPVAGRVIRVLLDPEKRCGYGVIIRDEERRQWRLCHMAAPPIVGRDATVRAGERLGVVGQTGSARAPHLHISLRDRFGSLIDPTDILSAALDAEQDRPRARTSAVDGQAGGVIAIVGAGIIAYMAMRKRR